MEVQTRVVLSDATGNEHSIIFFGDGIEDAEHQAIVNLAAHNEMGEKVAPAPYRLIEIVVEPWQP